MSTSIAPKRSASPLEDDPPTKAARPPWQELPNTGKADRQLTDSEYQNLKSSLDTEHYNVFIFEAAHICMANGSTGKSVVVSQIVSAMGKWLSLLDTNYERTVVYLQQWTSMFERERTKISDLSTLFERDISQYHNFSLLPRTYIVNKGNLHNEVALPAHSNHTPPTNYDQVTRAWNQDYIGSHDKLLLHNMDSSQSPESYGNLAAIVQSSGFGKSRTVDEIAKQVFTIPMNVRNPSDTSYFATQWREYLSKDIPPQYPLIQDINPLVDSLYFQEQQGKVRDLLYHMAI
ncbi:protein [Lentinula edodes]|uniref:Protein n=1 Tax=Lentinula edodes TaxID=5353 RepID=A0A1Q3E1J9_LENED|nr:protein [Lentinula edodes]